jgi:hypothetical protein
MLHTSLSSSSTNQLELYSTDPQDRFSYETLLGTNSSEKVTVGVKRNFSALSPAEINSSCIPPAQRTRDLRISQVPTLADCNFSPMGLALGLNWDHNDPSTQWLPPATRSLVHGKPNFRVGLDSESTAEEHGSEPDSPLKQTSIIPADNSSMDLLASIATGIIEVSPNLSSLSEIMDQFRSKQQQRDLLYRELSKLESRRKQAVDSAAQLSVIANLSARISQVALGKAYEARATLDQATEVDCEGIPDARHLP